VDRGEVQGLVKVATAGTAFAAAGHNHDRVVSHLGRQRNARGV
jgi:hypothetical protein